MVTLLEIILGGLSLLLLVPVTVLFIEVLAAVTASRPAVFRCGERGRLAVLVPAHDEASVITGTIRSVLPQLKASDRLLVIADNCSDDTAAIASTEGAEVIVRTDPFRRAKGYALDYGMRHLETHPPDIVVVIDADCEAELEAIDRLACLCARTVRPVQALYLMHASTDSSQKVRIAEFAWTVKNLVRPIGLRRLGLPCQLMGTGMAFPWALIRAARLASGHIVEDLKLGIELTRAGAAPLFCPEAVVTSRFPASKEGTNSQRERWEHGYLGVIFSEVPRLLKECLGPSNVDLLTLTLDLSVPPLALLALMVVAICIVDSVFCIYTKMFFPLYIATTAGGLLGAAVLLSWHRYGRGTISIVALMRAPAYALRKLPLYLRFLIARQKTWVRSKRDEGRS